MTALPDIPALALEELARRRHTAARTVAHGQKTPEQANLLLSYYCALASYAGATLPEWVVAQMRQPHDPAPIDWWEFTPRGVDMAVFLRAARKELQRATNFARFRHEQDPTAENLSRARRLIALYRALAQDALGPLPLALRADRTETTASSAAGGEAKQAA